MSGAELDNNRLGQDGRAYSFDGAPDRIDLGSTEFVNTDEPFSVSFWIYFDGYDDNCHDVAMLNSNGGAEAAFKIFTCDDSNYSGITFGSDESDNWGWQHTDVSDNSQLLDRWAHVVITYNGDGNSDTSNFSQYIDGETQGLTGSGGIGAPDDGNRSFIGTDGRSDVGWNGRIDDFRIYDRELSPSEVEALSSM